MMIDSDFSGAPNSFTQIGSTKDPYKNLRESRQSALGTKTPLGLRKNRGGNFSGAYNKALSDASNLKDLGAMVRGRRALESLPDRMENARRSASRFDGLREKIAGQERGLINLKNNDESLYSSLFGDI